MRLRKILTDENAVSPVIGVILMVAITVILAAVIGTFVLGLGDQVQSTAPSASFTFDFTDNDGGSADTLDVTHDGGDSITASQITFEASGVEGNDADGSAYTTGVQVVSANAWSDIGSSGDVTAGSTVTLGGAEFEYTGGAGGTTGTLDGTADKDGDTSNDFVELEGATVRVVWTSESGDNSATLGKWEGPDA